MLEALESRRLCSATDPQPRFRVDDRGTLRIFGTDAADVINVGGRNGNVGLGLNGQKLVITQTVRRAIIYGGAGNDRINGVFTPAFGDASFPIYADGGPGKDRIFGGIGNADVDARYPGDTLVGGSGNDTLRGTWGRGAVTCYLDGGPGDDTLIDGTVMHGGPGYDVATNDEYFVRPIFTSGLEQFTDARGGPNYAYVVPPRDYVSTLSTQDDKLVLSYLAAGREDHQLLAPYLRGDGRIGVTVTFDYPANGTGSPQERQTVTLNPRYTALARQRGIVLTFSGPAAGKPKDWEILLPLYG